MANSDLIMALVPSVVGNVAAVALGVAHGSAGDMPRLGAKKDDKGVPILDKDGNQQGGVPYDMLTAVAGYGAAAGFMLLAKGKTKEVGSNIALRVGDAGGFIYGYSWGGQMGQKSRKDAGKLTGQANSRTVTSGEQSARQSMGQGTPSTQTQTVQSPQEVELQRLFGVRAA